MPYSTTEDYSIKQCTADTQVLTGEGVIHTIITSMNDAAPTAGSVIVYDGVGATGPILYAQTWTTAVFQAPGCIILDVKVKNGIYVDFTTTADVNVFVTYK